MEDMVRAHQGKYRAWLKIIAMAAVCLFVINDILWANPEVFQRSTGQAPNALQVQTPFKPIKNIEVYRRFLVSSYILNLICHFGSIERVPKRLDPVDKEGTQISLRIGDRPQDAAGNFIVRCSLSSQKGKWCYEAVVASDGSITLRKPVQKTKQSQWHPRHSSIARLNNLNPPSPADIPVKAVKVPPAADRSAIDKVAELLKSGYPASVESSEKLAVYSARVKAKGDLAEIQDLPAAEIARQLDLFIDISDNLETITLYKIPPDSDFIMQDGMVDYSKLQLIASFKSNHLIFPDNYIAKHFSGELLSSILILFMSGGKYIKYRGTITTHDSNVDLDVWATSIDTVYIHKVLAESGVLHSDKIKTAAEIGVGGGHLSTALAQNLKELKDLIITDINAYALMAAKRNILSFAKKRDIRLTTYMGKGIKTLGHNLDLLLANPPYIPVPPWEKANDTAIDDPYKGTDLICEIIEDGINHLNPGNPDASIIMNYSSLAADDLKEYLRAYGKLVDVEFIAEGFEVPLKIERVDSRWIDWMRGRGLTVKEDAPEDGFKYWHTLNVVRIKPKRVTISYKDGRTGLAMLHNLKLEQKEAARWNNLTIASKLMILSLLHLEPKDYLWFDDEWRGIYQVVKYYQANTGKLKDIIEKQLDRKVLMDETDLLQSFYLVDDGFFSSNVIRHIYFTGKNPHVSPQVIQASRELVNLAPPAVKDTLLELFMENFRRLCWDKGIAEYLKKEHSYRGAFTFTDIADFSVGNGVYRIKIALDDMDGRPEVEFFMKRQHINGIDLRNEIAYLDCERLFLGDALVERLPFYYRNRTAGKPDLLIAHIIQKKSLDSHLFDRKASAQERELLAKVVVLLARHAALGDILGRNDRTLSNTMIFANMVGGIESIVDFDIAEMLDMDKGGDEPWYLNYDWIVEDVKQGISEITALTLLDGYETNRVEKTQREMLKTKTELFKLWRDEYVSQCKAISLPENVEKIKRVIRNTYRDTPAIVSEKIAVLEKRLKVEPEEFLKQIFSAQLVDYQMRRLYQDYLEKVKTKSAPGALGFVEKYLILSPGASLSSMLESFRGILSEDFLKRRRIKGRMSTEEMFKEADKLVGDHLGKRALDELKRKSRRIRNEARVIMNSCFAAQPREESDMTVLLKNILVPSELSENMIEILSSIIISSSGKKVVLAFGKNIKSVPAVKVFDVLNKLRTRSDLPDGVRKILENIVVITDVLSPEELSARLLENSIDINEKDERKEAKNILTLFATIDDKTIFERMAKSENIFSSYIDERKAAYDIEYYPLPEIVAITLSHVLDRLAGIDRLTEMAETITEIKLESGTITLSDINIEKVKRDGSQNLLFVLLPRASRHDSTTRRDRYILVKSLIETAL